MVTLPMTLINQSINVKFVWHHSTTHARAPTVVSGKHDQKVHSFSHFLNVLVKNCKKTEWWDAGVVMCLGQSAYGSADATATHYLLLQ